MFQFACQINLYRKDWLGKSLVKEQQIRATYFCTLVFFDKNPYVLFWPFPFPSPPNNGILAWGTISREIKD